MKPALEAKVHVGQTRLSSCSPLRFSLALEFSTSCGSRDDTCKLENVRRSNLTLILRRSGKRQSERLLVAAPAYSSVALRHVIHHAAVNKFNLTLQVTLARRTMI